MSDPTSKTFDCVQSMRQARDKISEEIAGMTYDELFAWLRGHHYEDPLLQRLADQAVRGSDAAGRSSAGP